MWTQQEQAQLRAQFPILNQHVNHEPLIYLDNAATTQKPTSVINELVRFYQEDNANIHRGVHTLAERSTALYEQARSQVQHFIGARHSSEIIFTSSTTAGLNFVAMNLVMPQLSAQDVIYTTIAEHHSNLVPWQEVAKRSQATLAFLPLDDIGQVDVTQLESLPVPPKVVAIHHVSNVLGVTQPIKEIAEWVHRHGGMIIVDGAQAVAHCRLNVSDLNVDAYCFSGHKLYGPTGIGVCYLNEKWHNVSAPFFYGGEMIHDVGDTESNYKISPWKFEGGTPPIAQAIGLRKAIEFMTQLGLDRIAQYEQQLTAQLVRGLRDIDGVQLYGSYNADNVRHGIVSFNIEGVHPHDAATGYDMEGIAVRAGHHCAQPLMRYLQVGATLRMSVAVYNTPEDIQQAIESTKRVKEFFTNGTI